MGRIVLKPDSASFRDVLNDLDIEGKLGTVAPKALQAGAEVLLPVITRNAPVRTGRLKAAIAIKKSRGLRGGKAVEVGADGGKAPHAHLVEQGHGGPHPAPAHPFLAPSVEEAEEAVMAAIMATLTEGL